MKKLLILIMMFGSVYSQCLGDMNGDGIKDILDIVNLVNDILDGDDICEEPLCLGDINGDGIKNVLDIISLINEILDGDITEIIEKLKLESHFSSL